MNLSRNVIGNGFERGAYNGKHASGPFLYDGHFLIRVKKLRSMMVLTKTQQKIGFTNIEFWPN